KGRYSGILVHAAGPDASYKPRWFHGVRCKIADGSTGDLLFHGGESPPIIVTAKVENHALKDAKGARMHFSSSASPAKLTVGSGWSGAIHRLGSVDPKEKKKGAAPDDTEKSDWNKLEINCDGDKIEVTLNGKKVNICTHTGPTKGKIVVQSENSEISFRK